MELPSVKTYLQYLDSLDAISVCLRSLRFLFSPLLSPHWVIMVCFDLRAGTSVISCLLMLKACIKSTSRALNNKAGLLYLCCLTG